MICWAGGTILNLVSQCVATIGLCIQAGGDILQRESLIHITQSSFIIAL